jgi:hypothetical protein
MQQFGTIDEAPHLQNSEGHGFFYEAKQFGQTITDDIKRLGTHLTHRASLELKNSSNELRIKIVAGIGATFAVTYAIFWTFAALVFWLYPSVPIHYSVTAIALLHMIAAGIFVTLAKRPIDLDDSAKAAIEKSQQEVKDVFHHLSVKTNEIKEIANESLNPMIKVKRNPEAFLVGSFLLGVALSLFMPASANGFKERSQN